MPDGGRLAGDRLRSNAVLRGRIWVENSVCEGQELHEPVVVQQRRKMPTGVAEASLACW